MTITYSIKSYINRLNTRKQQRAKSTKILLFWRNDLMSSMLLIQLKCKARFVLT